MARLVIAVASAAFIAACGGGAAATPTPDGTVAGTPAASAGGGGVASPGGPSPQYKAGAAKASVTIDSVAYPITGGTCSLESGDAGGATASKFTFAAGTAMKAGWLDIELTSLGEPIHDGDYKTGLSSVAVQVADDDLLVTDLRITLQNGATAGSFAGTSAGNSPKPVSGTFTC